MIITKTRQGCEFWLSKVSSKASGAAGEGRGSGSGVRSREGAHSQGRGTAWHRLLHSPWKSKKAKKAQGAFGISNNSQG